MLKKDPRDRYQSAFGALSDLETLTDALEKGIEDPPLAVGANDRRGTLTEPAFVGRDTETTELQTALEEAAAGRGNLVLLEAKSGLGKSRLLEELAQRAAQRGFWVLQGRGTDFAAQRPFSNPRRRSR